MQTHGLDTDDRDNTVTGYTDTVIKDADNTDTEDTDRHDWHRLSWTVAQYKFNYSNLLFYDNKVKDILPFLLHFFFINGFIIKQVNIEQRTIFVDHKTFFNYCQTAYYIRWPQKSSTS